MKGLFVTFEGGEGSGKSTVLEMVMDALSKNGIDAIQTREPGGVRIAEQIREVILDCQNTDMNPKTEALLYAASRLEHLDKKVLPALDLGKVVLCDRYLDSSLVYQGYARGLGIESVQKINYFALEHMPDITFFFDCRPEIGFERIKSNNRIENRLDLEEMSFHEKVYLGYVKLSQLYPNRIIRIDAERSIQEVFLEVLRKIEEKMNDRRK